MTSNSASRFPPPCWTDHETRALIAAYRDRWFSANRGSLRAPDWAAIASQVSSLSNMPLKTAVQCQHKVEKLRRRYRQEKKKLSRNPNSLSSSSWELFPLLDSMEIGSFGSHACNSTSPKRKPPTLSKEEEEGSVGGIARAIMVWGESFVIVEEMKMEVAKEIERMRMEMELQRDRMMLEMQVKLLNTVANGFAELEDEVNTKKKRKSDDDASSLDSNNGIGNWGKRY